MTIKLISLFFVIALLAIGALLILQQPTYVPLSPADWTPLNNGAPGWSNKVQPF